MHFGRLLCQVANTCQACIQNNRGIERWFRNRIRLLCGATASRAVPLIRSRRCAAVHTGRHGLPFPFRRVMRVLHQQQHQKFCLCFRFLSPCSPMSSPSATFWSDACTSARDRPLQAQLDAVYASCGLTVRRPPLLPLGACPAHACVAGCLTCV